MGYEILSEVLAGDTLTGGLFDAQTISYKKIISKNWRDHILPIGQDKTVFNPNNTYYTALKTKFDSWDTQAIDNLENNQNPTSGQTYLVQAVNSVAKMKGRKTIKRAKKQSNRVIREVRKIWKQGLYGDKKERATDLKDALELIHKAFLESFIYMRSSLRKDLFDCIPANLQIKLNSGLEMTVTSLYEYSKDLDKYVIREDIAISKTDMRNLQLLIAPYLFNKIYQH